MIDDQLLVSDAQANPQAFAALYDRYVDRIYTYVYRQMKDEALTQDVVSTTFEKALRNIGKFEWQGKSVVAWLYRIARNEVAQYYRRQRFITPWKQWHENRATTETRITETAVATHERKTQLHQAINRLSKKDRDILTLRFFDELNSDEIAQILGCSVDNVYVRLHRALKRLRQHLGTIDLEADSEATREVNYA